MVGRRPLPPACAGAHSPSWAPRRVWHLQMGGPALPRGALPHPGTDGKREVPSSRGGRELAAALGKGGASRALLMDPQGRAVLLALSRMSEERRSPGLLVRKGGQNLPPARVAGGAERGAGLAVPGTGARWGPLGLTLVDGGRGGAAPPRPAREAALPCTAQAQPSAARWVQQAETPWPSQRLPVFQGFQRTK